MMIRSLAWLVVVISVSIIGCRPAPIPCPTIALSAAPSAVSTIARTPTETSIPATATIEATPTTIRPTDAAVQAQPTRIAPTQSGQAAAAPEIHAFNVDPAEGVGAGDPIQVTWRAEGESARLCMAAYDYYGGQCSDVSETGSQTLTLGNWEGLVTISLDVFGDDPDQRAHREFFLFLGCTHAWVWDAMDGNEHCPGPREDWVGAAQPFQHGWMIWTGNHYFILFDRPSEWNVEGALAIAEVPDPLNITADTSSQYTAPDGFYAPESGFGLVWRGDVGLSDGFVDSLGWATQPEIRYEAIQQCWALKGYIGAAGGIQRCYFVHPAGGLIAIVRDGIQFYWEYIS